MVCLATTGICVFVRQLRLSHFLFFYSFLGGKYDEEDFECGFGSANAFADVGICDAECGDDNGYGK